MGLPWNDHWLVLSLLKNVFQLQIYHLQGGEPQTTMTIPTAQGKLEREDMGWSLYDNTHTHLLLSSGYFQLPCPLVSFHSLQAR